jgi:hypothetical protein
MNLLELWRMAAESKVGIAVETDNRKLLQQHLYRARAEAKDPTLDKIVMLLPEREDELWLVRRDADSVGTNNKDYPKLVHPRR